MKRLRVALLPCCLALLAPACNAAPAPDEFDLGMRALGNGDYAEAFCHWKPLAAAGHADAQYHLGWLYANGNGLAVNVQTALDWWQRAARQGHTDAQFAIGLAYTTGEGVGKDLDKAVDWYLEAARAGHPDARDILARLNGDPSVDLLDRHPEIARESWFGWPGRITRDRINVRDGPGTEFKVVTQLDKGTEVRVIGRRSDWLMVVLPQDGDVAWIYEQLVRETSG